MITIRQLKAMVVFAFLSFFSTGAWSAGGAQGFGINFAGGLPFLSQFGVNYEFSDTLGVTLGYNNLTVSVTGTTVSATMPELLLLWHPFSGSFFIGAGIGQETLTSTSTDSGTGQEAKVEIKATTAVAKLGWMWGRSDGGFWIGLDAEYILPSGASTTITSALPADNAAVVDAQRQANQYGNTAYTNVTFLRLGYIF